jgi:transcriptional regulator with XRE-family HTH domain
MYARENLRRLMAVNGWTLMGIAAQTGLEVRTIRGILTGAKKPHSQTLHRLAKGLGVSVDEFFVDPAQLLYRRFDRNSNPTVAATIEERPDLFNGWTEADFDELHSRVGLGGGLTTEGVLSAAAEMNRRRELHSQLDVLLESSQAEVVAGILNVLYEKVVVVDSRSASPKERATAS